MELFGIGFVQVAVVALILTTQNHLGQNNAENREIGIDVYGLCFGSSYTFSNPFFERIKRGSPAIIVHTAVL